MKLNKYILLLLLATAFLFNSCADFLDRDPLSQASENTFWITEADAEKGLYALYP